MILWSVEKLCQRVGCNIISISYHVQVQRIQNHSLYQQYSVKKKQMEKQNTGVENERHLWHGTSSDAIPSIYTHGFNRSYCGKNGKYKVLNVGLYSVCVLNSER